MIHFGSRRDGRRRVFSRRFLLTLAAAVLAVGGTMAGASGSASAVSARPLASAVSAGPFVHVVSAGPLVPAVSAKPDTPVVNICLTESRSYCADVKSNDNVAGETVWIWADGADDRWYESQVICEDYSCPCPDVSCFMFQNAENTSVCLGANPGTGYAELMGCYDITDFSTFAMWYEIGDHLENSGHANGYELTVQGPLYSGDPMLIFPYGYSGFWYQWSGP